ncbi:hypothetical protein LAZ67_X002150 [Cordylochernes scorpioides]|uniref:Reverse transcriptase RNase H-like domain-containing protein n=1 Tax=Cordylochernes scorpioides TaxID=51811 RepID=A0ABY6LY28_9ARAC|nr:hypothetical protein LAZ67_X002150 [Cordylochernes scorpioides]
MRRVAAKFVPKLLNCDQKQHPMNIANEILDSVRDDPNLLQRVITENRPCERESDLLWVYVNFMQDCGHENMWCGNPITHPLPRLPSTFHLGITTEPVKVDRITEDSNIQKMTEAEVEYFADALTDMQPHCDDLVSRLTDAIRGLAMPRAEEALIPPFDGSYAANNFIQQLERTSEGPQDDATLRTRLRALLKVEALTEGLQANDQRLMRAIAPKTLNEWYSTMNRIKGDLTGSRPITINLRRTIPHLNKMAPTTFPYRPPGLLTPHKATKTPIFGIAGILKQQQPDGTLHPVQYYSRALRPHEKNYTITELECLAVIDSVEKFRIYLAGVRGDRKEVWSDFSPSPWNAITTG